MNTDAYSTWLREESERELSERAAFSGESIAVVEPELELEPPVPTGFESFWA